MGDRLALDLLSVQDGNFVSLLLIDLLRMLKDTVFNGNCLKDMLEDMARLEDIVEPLTTWFFKDAYLKTYLRTWPGPGTRDAPRGAEKDLLPNCLSHGPDNRTHNRTRATKDMHEDTTRPEDMVEDMEIKGNVD